MFEQRYRQRLDADLVRWQAVGLIAPATGDAIRQALGPRPKSVDLATVVAIVGGLLIAAAFLAFVAANWSEIARPARFGILLAGIAAAYAAGAWFDRAGRPFLGDLGASAGSIIFGAAIALVGQMYHLGEDFGGGMALWALGALVAAALTNARGALAVSLVAGCIWSGMRMSEAPDGPHLPFIAFWLVTAGLAILWKGPVARHLVSAAAIAWWVTTAFALMDFLSDRNPSFTVAAGAALMFGAGLALAARPHDALRDFGLTLSTYAAFAFAVALAATIAEAPGSSAPLPTWTVACGAVGAALAFAAAALSRRPGPALGALAIVLGLVALAVYSRPNAFNEPWASYALALVSMLALTVSGMLDEVRPRMVAGWIGLGAAIAAITWAVKGSLLARALFLAVAGGLAIALASVLGRFARREAAP